MRRLMIVAAVIATNCALAWSAEQKPFSVAAMPPVVVKTVPEAGDTKVDPSMKEIKITFSKRMTNKSWSWVGDIGSWTNGQPRYLADGRTCVLPVKLEPGQVYAVWLNSEKFGNFKDTKGQAAVPYLLVFETAKK
jgi:hypothetical protein